MSLQQDLYAFFLIDQTLRGLRSRLDAATRRLSAQSKKLVQLEKQREELNEAYKFAQAKAFELEGVATDADLRASSLREKMNSVTNNKEYSALLLEVNTLKIEKSKSEESALVQLGEVDRLKKQLDTLDTDIAERNKLIAVSENEVKNSREEVGDRLDEVIAEREQAAAALPADSVKLYDRVSDMHDGEALAPIIEENKRRQEYTCGGCFIGIPFERLNVLMGHCEELISCPSCQRILYVGDDLREAMAPK